MTSLTLKGDVLLGVVMLVGLPGVVFWEGGGGLEVFGCLVCETLEV